MAATNEIPLPLQLPDIRELIFQHLLTRDIKSVSLVSEGFHESAAPMLWEALKFRYYKKITIQELEHCKSLEYMSTVAISFRLLLEFQILKCLYDKCN